MKENVPPFATVALLSVAMHFSIVIFCFVTFVLAHSQEWQFSWLIKPDFQIVYLLLSFVAVVNAMLVIFLPALFKMGEVTKKHNQGLPEYYSQEVSGQNKKSLFLNFKTMDHKVFTVTIIRFALAESVVVLGFVLSFINETALIIVPFAFVGLMLQIVFGPFTARILYK